MNFVYSYIYTYVCGLKTRTSVCNCWCGIDFSSSQWMLNFQACRHMGHCLFIGCKFSHLTMQCMWKQCEHTPHTSGQPSPGSAHSGHVLSNDIRQMPQFSSFAIQRHDATPIQDLIVTFILLGTFSSIHCKFFQKVCSADANKNCVCNRTKKNQFVVMVE